MTNTHLVIVLFLLTDPIYLFIYIFLYIYIYIFVYIYLFYFNIFTVNTISMHGTGSFYVKTMMPVYFWNFGN